MKISKDEQQKLAEIVGLIDAFCEKHLDRYYRELCEEMAFELYEEGLPLNKGKPAGWASGIVHTLGMVNFLYDPKLSPHITSAQVAEGFGVSMATMQAKSRIIRDELDVFPMDPAWCVPDRLEDNPLVWMFDVGGFITDIRLAPRKVQEEAYLQGLIPFIPADRQKPKPQSNAGPKIIGFPSKKSKISMQKSSQEMSGNEANTITELNK